MVNICQFYKYNHLKKVSLWHSLPYFYTFVIWSESYTSNQGSWIVAICDCNSRNLAQLLGSNSSLYTCSLVADEMQHLLLNPQGQKVGWASENSSRPRLRPHTGGSSSCPGTFPCTWGRTDPGLLMGLCGENVLFYLALVQSIDQRFASGHS